MLSWQAHLFRLRPARSAVVAVIVVAGVSVVHLAFGQAALTVLAAVLVLGALSQFFFPVSYRLTNRGVEIRHLGVFAEAVKWDDLTGYRNLGDCLVLARRRGRRKGGLMLYFHGNEQEVVSMVAGRLPEFGPQAPGQ